MKAICQHCKWWKRTTERTGVCDIPTSRDPLKSCEIDATAADDTGLGADLVTGPHFGCVLFTPPDSFAVEKRGKEYVTLDTRTGASVFSDTYLNKVLDDCHARNAALVGSYSVQRDPEPR